MNPFRQLQAPHAWGPEVPRPFQASHSRSPYCTSGYMRGKGLSRGVPRARSACGAASPGPYLQHGLSSQITQQQGWLQMLDERRRKRAGLPSAHAGCYTKRQACLWASASHHPVVGFYQTSPSACLLTVWPVKALPLSWSPE